MKLTIQLKHRPTPEQWRALLETINAACDFVSRVAFETRTFRRVPFHRVVYQEIRDCFGLPAQLAVHAITKVVNAYKRDRKKERVFKKRGAIIYDDRVLRSRKERNFTKTLNHTIAKRLVEKARKARAVLILEDLKGIRRRTTVRRERRHLHETWPYHQLRSFVLYKACLSGVPVVFFDPAHTSQTCPFCGCVDKRNRKSQSSFECVRCGSADHADRVAAVNIAARAAVNQPIVGWHGALSHVATAS